MNTKMKKLIVVLVSLAILAGLSYLGFDVGQPVTDSTASTQATAPSDTVPSTQLEEPEPSQAPSDALDVEGFYYSKEDVALFLHTYGRLPDNFVTKAEAKSQFGSNYKAMKAGYRVGGDTFGNREGLLPEKDGRSWTECDIVAQDETERGACRIVFSNDGLVYYTDDHYNSFELLYGEP